MATSSNEITIDHIYTEYGVYMHHSLFAGAVIEKMAQALLVAHQGGLPLPSTSSAATDTSNLGHEYDEFIRMKRIGLPDKVIIGQMMCAGLDVQSLFPDYEDTTTALPADLLNGLKVAKKHELKKVDGTVHHIGGPHSDCAIFRALLAKRYDATEPRVFGQVQELTPRELLRARRDSVKYEDSDSDDWSSSEEL